MKSKSWKEHFGHLFSLSHSSRSVCDIKSHFGVVPVYPAWNRSRFNRYRWGQYTEPFIQSTNFYYSGLDRSFFFSLSLNFYGIEVGMAKFYHNILSWLATLSGIEALFHYIVLPIHGHFSRHSLNCKKKSAKFLRPALWFFHNLERLSLALMFFKHYILY